MYDKYLYTKQSKNGLGVFTNIFIPKNSPVIQVKGELLHNKDLSNINNNCVLQVSPNTFIGPSGGLDDIVNHSCNPNCYIKTSGSIATIFSMFDILPNNEITYDYSKIGRAHV